MLCYSVSTQLCPHARPAIPPPCISHPLHDASAQQPARSSLITARAAKRAGHTHSHAGAHHETAGKHTRAPTQADSRKAATPYTQKSSSSKPGSSRGHATSTHKQQREKQASAERGRLAQILVNADRLDVVSKALQAGMGILSPTMLVQTVAPKLKTLLLQLPAASPHRRWGVEALARYLRAVTPYLPALGPAELLHVLGVMRSARKVKVLQMRSVTAFLHKQHAQLQAHHAATAKEVHGARAAEPAEAAADTGTAPSASTADPLSAAIESPMLSKLFEGTDPALQSLSVESWSDERDDAAAQLLRVLRTRVLRLCAAAVPATDTTASTPASEAEDASPGSASHPPSASTVTSPQSPASTHASDPHSPPATNDSAPRLPTSATGGVLVDNPDPIQAGLIVRVLREMLDLQVTWTPKQGKIIYAFLARALEASALDAGHAVSGLSSMARMCSLPTPPALANKVYAQIQAIPMDWRIKQSAKRRLQSINLPALTRLMAKDRLQRKAAQYQPPEAVHLQQQQQQQYQPPEAMPQQQQQESHPGTLHEMRQQQQAAQLSQQHTLRSSPPRKHRGRSPSTAHNHTTAPLPSASLSAGSRSSHMPVLASILGADMMPMLLPWPGEEGEHARYSAVAASSSLYPEGSDTIPVEARKLTGLLSVLLAHSGACHDPTYFSTSELGSIAASWRAAGLLSNQATLEDLTAATAPYTLQGTPLSGLALAQMLGIQTLHVAKDTGTPFCAGPGETLWNKDRWNWEAVQRHARFASLESCLPTWYYETDAISAKEQLASPSKWLWRYCSKATDLLHTPGALSIPQLWAIVARLVQLQLRAPSLLLLPLLPVGPVQPNDSTTAPSSQPSTQHQHGHTGGPRVVHGQGVPFVSPSLLLQQQASQGRPPQHQCLHPYLVDCPPLLPDVLEQLALAVGTPKSVGWDRPKVWDNWLDGRPFSECGCLPDLPGVVVLLEHMATVAQDATTNLDPYPPLGVSKLWSSSKGRKLSSSCFRGYLDFSQIAGSEVGAALWLDPSACANGLQVCVESFPGTPLMLELLLHCADAELASIGRACSVPGQKMLSVTPFQRATLASNRTAFMGRHSGSTTTTTSSSSSGGGGGSNKGSQSIDHDHQGQPVPSGSDDHAAFACHQLQLVLRLAATISALGIELSQRHIGALVVVLMRLLRPAESLPNFVRTVNLLPLLGVEMKSNTLKGTLLGMAQRLLQHPEQHLLPYTHLGLVGSGEPQLQQEQQHVSTEQALADQQAHTKRSQSLPQQHASKASEQPEQAPPVLTQHQFQPISLFPVLAVLRSLHVVGARAGRAVDVALSDALQHTFLAPQVVVVAPQELLELMHLMSQLACYGTSGAARSLQWHLGMIAHHVEVQHRGYGTVQGNTQGGTLSRRDAGSSSSASSSNGDGPSSGYASRSTLSSLQALQALHGLLGLGIMPAPQTAARLLKVALLGLQDAKASPATGIPHNKTSASVPRPLWLKPHRLEDRYIISTASLIVYPRTNQAALDSIQAATTAMDLWLAQQQPQAAAAAWAALDELEAQGAPVPSPGGVPGQEEGQAGGEVSEEGSREADSGVPTTSGAGSDGGAGGGRSLDDMLDSFIDAKLEVLKQHRDAR